MTEEDRDVQDLVETYKGLSPENRANLRLFAHATIAAQENTLKAIAKEKDIAIAAKNPQGQPETEEAI